MLRRSYSREWADVPAVWGGRTPEEAANILRQQDSLSLITQQDDHASAQQTLQQSETLLRQLRAQQLDEAALLSQVQLQQLRRRIQALESDLRYYKLHEQQQHRQRMQQQQQHWELKLKLRAGSNQEEKPLPPVPRASSRHHSHRRGKRRHVPRRDGYQSDPSMLLQSVRKRPPITYDVAEVSDGEHVLSSTHWARRKLKKKETSAAERPLSSSSPWKPAVKRIHVDNRRDLYGHSVAMERVPERRLSSVAEEQQGQYVELRSQAPAIHATVKEDGASLIVDGRNFESRGIYVDRDAGTQQTSSLEEIPMVPLHRNRPPLVVTGSPLENAGGVFQRARNDAYAPLAALGDSSTSIDIPPSPLDVVASPAHPRRRTVSMILNERGPESPKQPSTNWMKRFHESARTETIVEYSSERQRIWTQLFRWLNFIRAIATTSYGIYAILYQWQNPALVDLGAIPYCYAALVFLGIDLLVTFVKAFPNLLWCCWNVDTWDPFARTFSIWNLIADHELLLDVSPILANVIIKLYGFRLGELLTHRNAKALNGKPLQTFGIDANIRQINLWMLYAFAATLLLTIVLHTFRLMKTLVTKKRAMVLAALVGVKILFVLFDLVTNSFLLLEVLIFQQERMFELTLVANLVLAVFAVSPVISLTTNSLLNLPLHHRHLRMQLQNRISPEEQSGNKVSFLRVFRAALRKTFHPVITLLFGPYAAFSMLALAYILKQVYQVDFTLLLNVPSVLLPGYQLPPPAQFAAGAEGTAVTIVAQEPGYMAWLDNAQYRKDVLITMLWLNLIFNYANGVWTMLVYWIYRICCAGTLSRIRTTKG